MKKFLGNEIGDFWENFNKLHIFYWKTPEKPGNDFSRGYNKCLKKREIDFLRVSKSFDTTLRKVWENFQPI